MMKRALAILVYLSILFSFTSLWAQYREAKQVSLKNGQCFSYPESKVYLRGIKDDAKSTVYKNISTNINLSQLTDNSNVSYYFCKVTCHIAENLQHTWVALKDSPAQSDNMNSFVCPGVQMETVPLVGSLTTIAPIIYPFWSFESQISEINSLLKTTQFKLSNNEIIALDKKMNSFFIQLGESYKAASSDSLNSAGAVLLHIGLQKTGYEKLLDYYLKRLNQNNWNIDTHFNSADYYITNAIKMYGSHLRYK